MDQAPRLSGVARQVLCGAFYRIQKFLVAPEKMPNHLAWFKRESCETGLSGAVLLMVVYCVEGELYLIDAEKTDLELCQGVVIPEAILTADWLIYDFPCRSGLSKRPTLLMELQVAMGWSHNQFFTGRTMMLHLGAFTATIVIANLRSPHDNYLMLPVVFQMHHPLAFATENSWIIATLVS